MGKVGSGFLGERIVACVDDEEGGEVFFDGEFVAFFGAEDHERGGVGVGERALGMDDADLGELVGDGAPGLRIDRVRKAHAVFFIVVAVIARGRERGIV